MQSELKNQHYPILQKLLMICNHDIFKIDIKAKDIIHSNKDMNIDIEHK